MEDTSAAYPHGSITGRSIVSVRFLITDIFLKSDRRTVCPWHFFRGKIICGGRDARVLKIFQNTIFCGSDRGGVRRIYAVDVLRASDVTESSEYVIFSADRSDDRLYLFCSHRQSLHIHGFGGYPPFH